MFYNMTPCCQTCNRSGHGFATILVLFILLAIIGAWTLGF